MLKNRIFTILLILTLAMPVIAEDEISSPAFDMEPISQEVPETTVSESLPPLDGINYKQPVSKRKMAKKFILAMASVGVSSLLIFFALSFYNKVRDILGYQIKESSSDSEVSLEVPEDLTGAIKVFLEKTKWS